MSPWPSSVKMSVQVVRRCPVRGGDPVTRAGHIAVAQGRAAVPPRRATPSKGKHMHLDVVGHGSQIAGVAVPTGDLEGHQGHLPRALRWPQWLIDAPDVEN